MTLSSAETRRAVLLLSLAAFASSASLRICDPLLPALARGFDTTTTQAAVVITSTSVAYGLCQFLIGPFGDQFGKFRFISWACLASTLGALACALAPDLTLLSAARAFTGASTAVLIPLSIAWIGDAVSLEDRQPTLAQFMTGQIAGLIGGQVLGGLFADTVGWRWAFGALAGAYFLVGLLLTSASADLHEASMRGQPQSGAALGAWAGLRALAQSPTAYMVLSSVFLEAMALFSSLAFMPSYLHERFDISLFHAGSVVAVFGLGGLAYTAFARRWMDWLGVTNLPMLGAVCMSAALFILALGQSWHWAIGSSALAGLGFYQMHSTLQTSATQMSPSARGTAVSVFASCFFAAQAVGVAAAAWIVEAFEAPVLFMICACIIPVAGWRFSKSLKAASRPC